MLLGVSSGGSPFKQGVDFRATSGFVTDPANCYGDTAGAVGPPGNFPIVTPQGNNVGWSFVSPSAVINNQDISSIIDPRLAGNAYITGTTFNGTYTIQLPSSGTYKINLALGDAANGQGPMTIAIFDDTTLLVTPVNAASSGAGQWFDATGTLRTSASAWVTANPQGGGGVGQITQTFATTFCRFNISAQVGGTGNVVLAHLWINS
jgi:hypothetical protein